MGQRLVMRFQKNEETIAMVYYHWSAYSAEALMEVRKLLSYVSLKPEMSTDEIRLALIKYAESCGGGVCLMDHTYAYKIYPDEMLNIDVNRNYGLVAIREGTMKEFEECGEGFITVDIDNSKVLNYVLDIIPIEDYPGCEEFPEIKMDLTDLTYEQLTDAILVIKEHLEKGQYDVRYGGNVYGFIY